MSPLSNVLFNTVRGIVTDATGALQVIADYEKRWVVEEIHKAAKTGCRVESRQYATSARMKRVRRCSVWWRFACCSYGAMHV